MEANFLESSNEIRKYKGKWIAIIDTKIVASGDKISEVYEKVLKEFPHRTPLLHRIPTEDDVDTFIL